MANLNPKPQPTPRPKQPATPAQELAASQALGVPEQSIAGHHVDPDTVARQLGLRGVPERRQG